MAPNLIADQVTTLDIRLYLGNEFVQPINVAETMLMPALVTSVAYNRVGGSPLADDLQPTVTKVGRQLKVVYRASILYPQNGYHEILFDGRKVIAGTLMGLRQTVSRTQSQVLTVSSGVQAPITLTVATNGPRIGELRYADENLQSWNGVAWIGLSILAVPLLDFPYDFPAVLAERPVNNLVISGEFPLDFPAALLERLDSTDNLLGAFPLDFPALLPERLISGHTGGAVGDFPGDFPFAMATRNDDDNFWNL